MSQPPTASQLPLAPGSLVGGYRIERLLGSGGIADVYYAMDQRLDRPVALKVLRPALALDEIHLQRFEQEAKAAASLVHPNIVQITMSARRRLAVHCPGVHPGIQPA